MKQALKALYASLQRGTQRRLRYAVVGMFVSGMMDVVGLAMIVPLVQLLTDPNNPSGISKAIGSALGDPSTSSLVLILAGVVFLAFIAKGAFSLWLKWWILGFTNHEAADASSGLFRRYMSAPYTYHLQHNSAELLRTMNAAVEGSYVGMVTSTMNFLIEAVTAGLVLLVLLVARPIPAIAAIAYFSLIAYGFQHFIKHRAKVAGDELMASSREATQAALQGLGGIKEILVRGTAPYFAKRLDSAKHRQADANRTKQFLNIAPRYAIEMMFILGVAVLSVAIFASGSSTQGAATLGLFVAAGFRLLPSLSRMVSAVASLRVNKPAVDLVLADLAEVPLPTEVPGGLETLRLTDRIALDSLVYHYPGSNHDVLHGVSLEIPKGWSVALVGSSGAGKTTIVDILLGLLEPTSGRVTIDDDDLTDVRQRWQRSIGLVPQDVYLFDDSLRANIAFGQPDDEIDEERLAEALHRAQLDELISGLPEGLLTVVGERGVRLSGGQLQRIGIARALYLRPQLLVLDEATSALDNVTERNITSTIESLHGEVTMVVVAHRLSTVRRCDKLIFMSDGKIESVGTFDEVRETNATFAHLVQLGSLESLDELQPVHTTG